MILPVFIFLNTFIMSRQSNNPRKERKNEEHRNEQSQAALRNMSTSSRGQRDERNRADNTRITGLDKHRLNDLYERSGW
jgi:hypothetical protein